VGKLDERCCGWFEHLLRIYIPFALHGVSEMITMFSAILESSPYLFSKRALLVLVKSYIRASLPLPSIHLFLSPSPFGAEVRLRTEPHSNIGMWPRGVRGSAEMLSILNCLRG